MRTVKSIVAGLYLGIAAFGLALVGSGSTAGALVIYDYDGPNFTTENGDFTTNTHITGFAEFEAGHSRRTSDLIIASFEGGATIPLDCPPLCTYDQIYQTAGSARRSIFVENILIFVPCSC